MEIKLYTNPSCEWSKKLRTWLRRKRLVFQELDLTESSKWRDEHLDVSNQLATPVIQINGEVFVGFKKEILEPILEKAKAQDKLDEENSEE